MERIKLLTVSFFRVWVPIVALVISVVGVPWAIRRAIDWAFFQQVIVLDGASFDAGRHRRECRRGAGPPHSAPA